MNNTADAPAFAPSITRSVYDEVRRQQRLIDAKVTLAEEQVRALLKERKDLEKTLWVEIERPQLIALLKDGSYGKSLDVRTYSDAYSYDSRAALNEGGELLIGGYMNHDHFRWNRPVYVRGDLGRYS